VDVIGRLEEDFALNVHFDADGVEDAWFARALVEFVDHAPGTEAAIGDRRLRRDATGVWQPID
jgi:hypothetical protein